MKLRRFISLALILVLTMACLPFTSGMAFAEEADGDDAQVLAIEDGDTMIEESTADDESAPVDDVVPMEEDFILGEDDALPEDDGDSDLAPGEDDVMEELPLDDPDALDGAITDDDFAVLATSADDLVPKETVNHTVKITQSGSTVTIKGSVPSQYLLGGVIVDRTWIAAKVFGSSIDYSFNINSGSFDTGYHTVVVGIYHKNADGSAGNVASVIEKKYVSVNKFTDKPSYKGRFEVYSTYFNIYPFQMSAFGLYAPKLYLEYSDDNGKTWKRSGYMKPGGISLAIQEGYKIGGLKSNTIYKTRLRYGEYVTYSTDYDGDGKSYFFGGPVLYSYQIHTGMAKAPAIKSVTLKAIKVKYHKLRHPGYYSYVGGTLFWHKAWTERWYTCNYKVTVKLKQKPGANGIWITVNEGFGHTKFVGGNKKTYTFTFTPNVNYFSRKPKKCKLNYTVSVRSGFSSNWGGYSPAWSAKRRLR